MTAWQNQLRREGGEETRGPRFVKDLSTITHGLAVVDSGEDGSCLSVVHFVGFWEEPSEQDIVHIREEIAEDEGLGLTSIAHRLTVLRAPRQIVDYFVKEFVLTAEQKNRRNAEISSQLNPP